MPGDTFLAGKGFTPNQLLKPVNVNIPVFKINNVQFSVDEVLTQNIARERVHVERAIGRLKNYKILSSIIPLSSRAVKFCIIIRRNWKWRWTWHHQYTNTFGNIFGPKPSISKIQQKTDASKERWDHCYSTKKRRITPKNFRNYSQQKCWGPRTSYVFGLREKCFTDTIVQFESKSKKRNFDVLVEYETLNVPASTSAIQFNSPEPYSSASAQPSTSSAYD